LQSKHILAALLCLPLLGGGLVYLLAEDDAVEVDYDLWGETSDLVDPGDAGTLTGDTPDGDADEDGDRTELDDSEVANGPGTPAQQLRPPVVIHGRVVNKFRAGVAGASIKLSFGRSGGRGRRSQVQVKKPVVTKKDGTFEFHGEGFKDLRVNLEITHEDHALTLHRDTFQGLDTDGDVDIGEIEVVTGGTMTGAITDMAGIVLLGAEARLLPQDGRLRNLPNRWKLFPPVKANNSGFFRIEHIPPGQYRVVGVAPHRQRRYTDIVTVPDAEEVALDPIQLGPGFQLTGRIFKPEGGPVAKAEVSLLFSRGWSRAQRGRTDNEGNFSFDHLAAGNYALQVRAKGYLQHKQNGIQVERAPQVNITLVNGLRVSGIILDAATNQPVTSYAARVRRVGSFADPKVERLRVVYEDMRRSFDTKRRQMNGRQRRQAERKLREVAMKLRENGVSADRRNQQQRNRDRGRNRRQNLPRDAGKPEPRPAGKFSFDGLEEGIYVVNFSTLKYQRIRSERIELRRGGVTPYLTLYMERGLLVAGTILDKQGGGPIPNARVDLLIVRDPEPARTNNRPNPWREVSRRFQAPGPSRGISFLRTRTDKKGEFRLQQAGQGTYQLIARADGHARGFTEPFELTGDLDGQELMLGRLGVIHGRVHGIPLDKLDKARVIVTDLRRSKTVKVNPDMTYRAEDLHPGNYMVRAFVGNINAYRRSSMRRFRAAGGNPSQVKPDVKIEEGSNVEFTAHIDQDPIGDVQGQLLVNGFGSGARGFRIHMVEINPMGPNAPRIPGPGNWRANRTSATVDQKGHYRLKDVMAGQYNMTIRAAGRRGAEVHRQIVYVNADQKNTQPAISLMLGTFAGAVIPQGAAADNLKARKRLRGNVQLLPGVTEMPKDWREYRRNNPVHSQQVRNGKFKFENVPLGDYLMVLRINRFAPRIQQIYADGSQLAQEYRTGKRRQPKKKKPKPKPGKPKGTPGGKQKANPKGASGKKPKGGKAKPKPKPKGKRGR